MNKLLRLVIRISLLAGLTLAVPLSGANAQDDPSRIVDSVERYRQKIEGLIDERISSLVPNQKYVLRATIESSPVTTQAPAGPQAGVELPGFRATVRDPSPVTTNKFRIDRITVRIVLKDEIPQSDIDYLRTVVPILADFKPELGDRLALQIVPKEAPVPDEESQEPIAALVEEPAAEPQFAQGWTLQEWILLGALALILLLLLVVMFRVFFMPKPEPPALPVLPAQPKGPTLEELSAEEKKRQEEALHQQEVNEQIATQRDALVKRVFARSDLANALIENWQDRPDDLNGIIHALGPKFARKIMIPHLGAERYQALEEAVLGDESPDADSLLTLMREANLFLVTQEIAEPEQIIPDPFEFLTKLSRGQIGFLIKEEPIKVKALVLGRVDPKDTAQILESFPKDLQLELAVEIGNMQNYALEAAESVARDLAEKVRFLPDARTVDIEGTRSLVDLMGRTTPDTSKYLLQAMKAKDTKLADEVERLFFLFESLPLVPDELLPQVVRTMPSAVVIRSLHGADQDLQRKVIMAFPDRARTGIVTSLRAAEFDEDSVLEARREVVARFQALALEGKIDLKQISDAWQSQAEVS